MSGEGVKWTLGEKAVLLFAASLDMLMVLCPPWLTDPPLGHNRLGAEGDPVYKICYAPFWVVLNPHIGVIQYGVAWVLLILQLAFTAIATFVALFVLDERRVKRDRKRS